MEGYKFSSFSIIFHLKWFTLWHILYHVRWTSYIILFSYNKKTQSRIYAIPVHPKKNLAFPPSLFSLNFSLSLPLSLIKRLTRKNLICPTLWPYFVFGYVVRAKITAQTSFQVEKYQSRFRIQRNVNINRRWQFFTYTFSVLRRRIINFKCWNVREDDR